MTRLAAELRYRDVRLLASAIGLWIGLTSGAAEAADDLAGPWTPYRVELAVRASSAPDVTAACVAETTAELVNRLGSTAGAGWELKLHDPTAAPSLRAPSEPASSQSASCDKRFDVELTHDGRDFLARVREHDPVFGSIGPVVVARAADRRLLADAAFDAVWGAFRPVGRIVSAEPGRAILTLRAEGLLPREARQRCVRLGDAYLPVLRARRRDGTYEAAKPIPWTMLEVAALEQTPEGLPTTVCELRSGLNNPLGSRRRGRYEAWVVAAGRPTEPTSLVVQSQSGGAPLADCEVFSIDSDKRARSLGRTDAAGKLLIEPTDGRVRRLVITGRYLPLAQLPMLPGLQPSLVVPVPADAGLRSAEDWLTDWQTEFLDLYIRRRALLTAAEMLLTQGDKSTAAKLLDQVDRLGSPSERINSLEVRRRSAAAGEGAGARIVDQLYGDVVAAVRSLDDAATMIELRKRAGE